jgi:succinyl-CoA synthetase alpha subunit
MSATVRCLVRRDTYRDSVELMRVASEVERLPSVSGAALLMGTPANRELLAEAGLLVGEAGEAGPNDLVVAVDAADEQTAAAAIELAERLLAESGHPSAATISGERPPPRTIAEAVGELPAANLAIISTPGPYATAEALKALKRGLHVFLFSDNVPIEDEVELKRLARRKGLLMMGPDCGTAILDGVPIGFANAVRRGRIGLLGASGTGLQQVGCLIDRLGQGVSQVIGVGGHDLTEQVGGLMMLAGIERLVTDPETAVIVLVSKPPAASVAKRVLGAARKSGKPVVVCFLGGDPGVARAVGAVPATTLEEAAESAVAAAGAGSERAREPDPILRPPSRRGKGESSSAGSVAPAPSLVEKGRSGIRRSAAAPRARSGLVRGLYSGGTLAQEAALILAAAAPGVGHTVVDLGADEYTVGRPHPMIDFRLRNEQIVAAAEDPATRVILLDVVLGYGSHPDPAGALTPAIEQARQRAVAAGRELQFVASVCGATADPQGLEQQERRLEAAGVILAPSNARAAGLAALLASAETVEAGQVGGGDG